MYPNFTEQVSTDAKVCIRDLIAFGSRSYLVCYLNEAVSSPQVTSHKTGWSKWKWTVNGRGFGSRWYLSEGTKYTTRRLSGYPGNEPRFEAGTYLIQMYRGTAILVCLVRILMWSGEFLILKFNVIFISPCRQILKLYLHTNIYHRLHHHHHTTTTTTTTTTTSLKVFPYSQFWSSNIILCYVPTISTWISRTQNINHLEAAHI